MFFEEAQIAPSMYFTKHGFILGFLLLAAGHWLLIPGCLSLGRPAARSKQPVASLNL
jgi:hypothetical protein